MKILVDWNLWENPKLLRLAELLGRSRLEATGLLVRLWGFTAEFLPSGSLETLTPRELAQACNWRGTPGKLVTSLRKSGWLDNMQVHEWQAHQGQYIEKIESERHRKKQEYVARRIRATRAPFTGDSPVKCAPPSPSPSPSPVSHLRIQGEEGADAPPPFGDFVGRMSLVWNKGPGYPMANGKAAKLIQCSLDRGTDKQKLEESLMDQGSCKGMKLWEVLDPITPKPAPGGRDFMKEIWEKFLKGEKWTDDKR